jgi:hypothetical protein
MGADRAGEFGQQVHPFAEAWPADSWSATIRRRVHGQRPPLGGETTVARRTLCDQAARAPRAKGWDRQPNAAPAEKEGRAAPLAGARRAIQAGPARGRSSATKHITAGALSLRQHASRD